MIMQPGKFYICFSFETVRDLILGPFDTSEEAWRLLDHTNLENEIRAVASYVHECKLVPVMAPAPAMVTEEVEVIPY